MKRPHHMTMSELIALPVIAHADELMRLAKGEECQFGGAFTDPDGFLWHTVRTEGGWARYPACLVLFVGAGPETSRIRDDVAATARPQHAMLAAYLRAFG